MRHTEKERERGSERERMRVTPHRGRKSKNRPHKSPRTMAPIVCTTLNPPPPSNPLTNYPACSSDRGWRVRRRRRRRRRERAEWRKGGGGRRGNLLPEVSIFSGGLRCVYGNSRPPSTEGSFPKAKGNPHATAI